MRTTTVEGVIPVVVVVAVVVMVAAAVDVDVLATVVGVGAAAEARGSGVAEAEGVGGEVDLVVGVGRGGGGGGGYAHGLAFLMFSAGEVDWAGGLEVGGVCVCVWWSESPFSTFFLLFPPEDGEARIFFFEEKDTDDWLFLKPFELW